MGQHTSVHVRPKSDSTHGIQGYGWLPVQLYARKDKLACDCASVLGLVLRSTRIRISLTAVMVVKPPHTVTVTPATVMMHTHATGANMLVVESRPRATRLAVSSLAGYATTVSTEKARRASATDMVPIDDERRPANGTLSGERLQADMGLRAHGRWRVRRVKSAAWPLRSGGDWSGVPRAPLALAPRGQERRAAAAANGCAKVAAKD